MIYYISDLHFGHRRILELEQRPFSDIEDMDKTLIRLWNETVTEQDDIYIVGDFSYRSDKHFKWYLSQLKGHKHLILGNHDYLLSQDQKALSYFDSVECIERIVDNERVVILCHFPIAEWNGKQHGSFHVYGHIHAKKDDVFEFMSRFDKALNAGCMINNYRPVTLNELMENNKRFRREIPET